MKVYRTSTKSNINPTYYGPFGATPVIGGGHGHNVPPIGYACSICAILMKISGINPAHYGPFGANPGIFFWGEGYNAFSICAILLKLLKIKQLDK